MIDIFKQNASKQTLKITGLPQIERRYKNIENEIKINQNIYKNNDDVFYKLNENKSSLFTAKYKDIWIPNHISYENELHAVHDQDYGTCGIESATTLIEWWMWKKTGKKYVFTRNEIHDIAADTNGLSYSKRKKDPGSAWPHEAIKSAYKFNDNLSLHYWSNEIFSNTCDKFKKMIDKEYGSIDNAIIYLSPSRSYSKNIKKSKNMDYVRYILNVYGCTTWVYYEAKGNPPTGHAVCLCKADETGVWVRNSWGSKILKYQSISFLDKNLFDYWDGLDICFKPC